MTVKGGFKKRRGGLFFKGLALGLAAMLALEIPCLPPAFAREAAAAPAAGNLFHDLTAVTLPSKAGRIEEIYRGTGSEIVVLIQDAHAIPDAQHSIYKTLSFFQSSYGIDLVGLEGAASVLDPQIFQSFPDPALLRKTLGAYGKRGELTGVTAAALLPENAAQRGMIFQGIENGDLYEKGIAAFLKALAARDSLLAQVGGLSEALRKEKETVYSSDLLAVDKALEEFRRNHTGLLDLLARLAQALPPEKGSRLAVLLEEQQESGSQVPLDIEVREIAKKIQSALHQLPPSPELEKDRQALSAAWQQFNVSEIPAQEFGLLLKKLAARYKIRTDASQDLRRRVGRQKKMKDIQGTQLFSDLERYVEDVKESLFKSPEERTLDARGRKLEALERLARLEITQDDWTLIRDFIRNVQSWTVAQDGIAGERDMHELVGLMKPHLEFYELAQKRDEVFYERASALMQKNGRDSMMIVAGGFHTEGLTRKLKAKGVSYVLVTPAIEELPEDNAYLDQMQGKVSWSSYFRIENGKVNLYDAFVRGLRDELLKAENGKLLKPWRDQLLRDLAEAGRIEDARRYTRFFDELAADRRERVRDAWLANIDGFADKARGLQEKGTLDGPAVLQALEGLVSVPQVTAAALSQDFADPRNLPALRLSPEVPAAAKSELREQGALLDEYGLDAGFFDYLRSDELGKSLALSLKGFLPQGKTLDMKIYKTSSLGRPEISHNVALSVDGTLLGDFTFRRSRQTLWVDMFHPYSALNADSPLRQLKIPQLAVRWLALLARTQGDLLSVTTSSSPLTRLMLMNLDRQVSVKGKPYFQDDFRSGALGFYSQAVTGNLAVRLESGKKADVALDYAGGVYRVTETSVPELKDREVRVSERGEVFSGREGGELLGRVENFGWTVTIEGTPLAPAPHAELREAQDLLWIEAPEAVIPPEDFAAVPRPESEVGPDAIRGKTSGRAELRTMPDSPEYAQYGLTPEFFDYLASDEPDKTYEVNLTGFLPEGKTLRLSMAKTQFHHMVDVKVDDKKIGEMNFNHNEGTVYLDAFYPYKELAGDAVERKWKIPTVLVRFMALIAAREDRYLSMTTASMPLIHIFRKNLGDQIFVKGQPYSQKDMAEGEIGFFDHDIVGNAYNTGDLHVSLDTGTQGIASLYYDKNQKIYTAKQSTLVPLLHLQVQVDDFGRIFTPKSADPIGQVSTLTGLVTIRGKVVPPGAEVPKAEGAGEAAKSELRTLDRDPAAYREAQVIPRILDPRFAALRFQPFAGKQIVSEIRAFRDAVRENGADFAEENYRAMEDNQNKSLRASLPLQDGRFLHITFVPTNKAGDEGRFIFRVADSAKANGRIVGYSGFTLNSDRVNLGFHIFRAFRGENFVNEVFYAGLGVLFNRYGKQTFAVHEQSQIADDNPAEQAKKVAFYLRRGFVPDQSHETADNYLGRILGESYALTKEDAVRILTTGRQPSFNAVWELTLPKSELRDLLPAAAALIPSAYEAEARRLLRLQTVMDAKEFSEVWLRLSAARGIDGAKNYLKEAVLVAFAASVSEEEFVWTNEALEIRRREVQALLATLDQIKDKSFTLGLALTEGAAAGETSMFGQLARVLQQHPGRVSEMAFNLKLPAAYQERFRALDIHLRPVNLSRSIIPMNDQAGVPLLVAGQLAEAVDRIFVPLNMNKDTIDDPLLLDYAELLRSVAALHLADLIAGDAALLKDPARLKASLLARLLRFDNGFQNILKNNTDGWGFTVEAAVARAYLAAQVAEAVAQAA
ncbi:MAG TPA: hypothetical protein VL688_00905 [Verrucomicrobiae bacterium]|nr:hypothetical protein [Verrucomicrobiae bacterium]